MLGLRRRILELVWILCLLVLCGCGGGSGVDSAAVGANRFALSSTVGGTVVGLIGAGLVLQNNRADDLAVSVSASGTFHFSDTVPAGRTYAVSVKVQPSFPNQTCTVAMASGVANGNPISDVAVTCTSDQTPAYLYAASLNDGSISSYAVDAASGVPTLLPGTAGVTPGPPGALVSDSIALASDPAGKYFAAVSTIGTVCAYLGNTATGALEPVATYPNALPHGYGAVIAPQGPYLYVALPYSNSVSGFSINARTGTYAPIPGSPQPAGNGAYALQVDPSGRYLFVADAYAGLTEFSIDPGSGALAQMASVVAGTSPGSVAVDPRQRFVFVLNETDDSVSSFAFNPQTGALTPSAVSLTPGAAVAPGAGLWSMAIAPTGNTVYITNTPAATVSSYAVNPVNGALTLVGTTATGPLPAQIVVDASGRFAYVGSFSAYEIYVYAIDPVTGTLHAAGETFVPAGAPMSLVVIDHS